MSNDYSILVKIDDNDSANWALKKFKRQCEAYGILKEYRKRKEYKKPSLINKEKREAAEKRRMKDLRKSRRFSKI
ncbi:MAG: 30S ribosomal protein S21 [Bacteriovorax sp. MedPE-SWde]|nr:MAG: 30S ribosomal protein S21 [Bacteriovorax sp. MedPE-SWde]